MPKVLVADYMASVGTRAVTQTDIIRDIKSKKNVRLRMTSVRRALDALEDAGDVERIRDTKAWRAVPKLRSVT
jgi:Fe2+ or Zn2+ uptake regulation protein